MEAVLFDLDETLYRERRFMLSGFAAVAALISERTTMSARAAFRILVEAARRGERGRAFQYAAAASGLDAAAVPELLVCYRTHVPRLRLPHATRAVLHELQAYAIAIVTNGDPAVQARKVQALGLDRLVQTVVYAEACGTGRGKPDPLVFAEALARLGVPAARAVFVGDHPWCDIAGARAAGLRTIRIARRTFSARPVSATVVLHDIRWIPATVRALLHARAA